MALHRLTTRPLFAALLVALCTGFLALAEVGLAQAVYNNTSGEPFMIANIGDEEHQPYAQLFAMPGAKMTMSPLTGWPISGAGFIQAVKDRTYYIPFTRGTAASGIRVRRIEWNNSGRIVALDGLSSDIGYMADGLKESKHIKITSDIVKPKLVAGILYIRAGKDGQEYKFVTSFGKGVSISPESFWTLFK